MVEIEYNKIKISVPSSWDDITLGLYESLDVSKPTTSREQVNIVAKICKVDPELLLGWPAEIYSEIIDYIDFLFKDNPAKPNPEI